MARTTFFLAWVCESNASNSRKRQRGQDGPGPGAEVLGGELLAGDLAEVVVHVGRVDRVGLAVVVDVLEEFLAGQVAAALDDPGEPAVVQVDRVLDAALAPEPEPDRAARRRRRGGRASWSGRTSWLTRAYSSLPTRIRVVSSRRTTVASTFSRGRPGRARSASTRVADRGQGLRRRPSSGRTWSRRGPTASAGGSGTACAPWRRGPWPGCGRRGAGRSRRRSRPAG